MVPGALVPPVGPNVVGTVWSRFSSTECFLWQLRIMLTKNAHMYIFPHATCTYTLYTCVHTSRPMAHAQVALPCVYKLSPCMSWHCVHLSTQEPVWLLTCHRRGGLVYIIKHVRNAPHFTCKHYIVYCEAGSGMWEMIAQLRLCSAAWQQLSNCRIDIPWSNADLCISRQWFRRVTAIAPLSRTYLRSCCIVFLTNTGLVHNHTIFEHAKRRLANKAVCVAKCLVYLYS